MTKALPLLEFTDVHVHFPIRAGFFKKEVGRIRAVNGVSFTIRKGQAFGLVGESGCGKSTVARAALRLEEATSGSIRYAGEHISLFTGEERIKFRKRMQAVFQDPFSSLNPRMKAGQIIAEPIRVHGVKPAGEVRAEVDRLLELVGLPLRFANLYPHEMSGGQRQRIGIARALALGPELIVADEAVSALDVSIQAQIITLLEDLQRDLGLTYLFIGHDLSVVRHICDQVAVMYLGRIVEMAPSEELFANPTHPYTRALIDAVPNPDPAAEAGRHIEPLQGEVPSPANPPSGCVFHPRCPLATDRCRQEAPDLGPVAPEHSVACWNAG
ncbi:ABC transporter ATP-binding protein [Celeribacter neptunius]|uniref:Oligopeptide transport system ATP-binding protein n=1 Tax=Celeribacter neptunius TaxID=588602 RepID=A0A1I3NRH7_9RHOB|nr:ABC transporter ATP-binding protein [Celeribacter neptunius]SFJ11747.1 oligopeptide transport system ATP-binding protein [Celeribacter neptunius]